jgi:hypothetical protein
MAFDSDIQAADAITLDRIRTQLLRHQTAQMQLANQYVQSPTITDWLALYEIHYNKRATSMTSATTDTLMADIVADAVKMTNAAFDAMALAVKPRTA